MARTCICRSWPEGFHNRQPGSGVRGVGNGHEQAVGSQEGGMVTNRQWGQRREEWSRTGSGVTGGGSGHEQAVGSQEEEKVTNRQRGHGKGNGHEQTVGSQEGEWSRTGSGVTGGGNTVAVLLVTDRQWCRSWLTAKTVFANRKWARPSLAGKEACVPRQPREAGARHSVPLCRETV